MEKGKETFEPKHYSIGSDILFFVRFYRQQEPVVLVFCGTEILLCALLPLFLIYLPKLTVDLVEGRAGLERLFLALGGFTVLLMLLDGLKSAVSAGKYNLYNTQRGNLLGLFFLKSLRIRYEYAESGSVRKLYGKALNTVDGGDWCASSRMVTETCGLLINILSFFLYSTVIGSLSLGVLAVLLALSVVNYLLSMSHIRYEESLREENALANKHYYCVQNAMGDMGAAKDIRIFGMQHWLLGLRDVALKELDGVTLKSRRRNSFYEKIGYLLSAGRDLGAYAWLLYQTAGGKLSAGEFVLYFGAVTGFSGFVTGIMGSLAALRGAANGTDYTRAYLDLPEEDLSSGTRHIEELRFPPEIEFRNVCFSYKNGEENDEQGTGEKEIFHDLNLTIRSGERIALVGVNGAGKTTFVKLLCGIYEPDAGQILINGIDRNEFPRTEVYQLFSAIFQEQMILPFTVGENLALKRADEVDEKRAWAALERAGLKETFQDRKIGIKTYMTKTMMEDGVELSGGQQQRFLLARALYKDAPVLVLDEPTAALDPIAESEVYEQYDRYSSGKTAVFISHRLASTRFSDRIVLIENGRILETGTHEELMRAGGVYAEMFEIQSSYYREGADEDEHGSDR